MTRAAPAKCLGAFAAVPSHHPKRLTNKAELWIVH